MANIKSAKKRILVNRTKAARNKSIRSEVKTSIKKVEAAVAAKDKAAELAEQGAEYLGVNIDGSPDEYDIAVAESAYKEYVDSGRKSTPVQDFWKELDNKI